MVKGMVRGMRKGMGKEEEVLPNLVVMSSEAKQVVSMIPPLYQMSQLRRLQKPPVLFLLQLRQEFAYFLTRLDQLLMPILTWV